MNKALVEFVAQEKTALTKSIITLQYQMALHSPFSKACTVSTSIIPFLHFFKPVSEKKIQKKDQCDVRQEEDTDSLQKEKEEIDEEREIKC